MKYAGMPGGMWLLFGGSFRRNLADVLKYDRDTAGTITGRAKRRYREIIRKLPEFEKGDRFKMNIISCAMLSAFLLSLPEKPSVDAVTEYYRSAMMSRPMLLFCRLGGKNKFTDSDIKGMKETAKLKAADRNPYSWNMEFLPYKDGSGYEARFSRCGICTLMQKRHSMPHHRSSFAGSPRRKSSLMTLPIIFSLPGIADAEMMTRSPAVTSTCLCEEKAMR